MAEISIEAATEDIPLLATQLRDLAIERKALLDKAIESGDFYLRKLGELESAQRRLLRAIENYDRFLDEHLFWVRSASRAQVEELGALPEQVWRILSPTGWLEVARALVHQATHSVAFVLLALALGALLWGRKHLTAKILAIGDRVGKPTTDHFGYSIQTLVLTLIAAATGPVVMAVTGWQLKVSVEATDFSNAVGGALLHVALQFFFLRAFHMICMPKGLAAAHFRWPEYSLQLLRRELARLTWIYLPAAMVIAVAFHLDPLNAGWAIGRTSFVIIVAALSFAFYRLLHPTSGALDRYMDRPDRQTFRRLHRIGYPLMVVYPLALGVLYLIGYLYTAETVLVLLVRTTWMIVGLIILDELFHRWLLVSRRRLAYEAAMERRQAIQEEKQEQKETSSSEEDLHMEAEEPEVDLVALSDTSRKLLKTTVVVSGLIGLWMIWSEVFPALHIFDDVTLWHHTASIDGEDKQLPITLGDIGMAMIYGVGTIILAKQLPAVLEIILLQRFDLSSGNRYTITTLTTYAIVTIGIFLALNTIGAQWSQLQWLVAALGVGIGFGLQEIVANFISGLIILFERPIRIGDIVTVGDTDGLVTKIRIRATTIRNWDRKELLVPNKEFITGRLLNWSLSDQTTRLLISVGIAYGSNVREAMRLLEEAASENENVLDDPEPSVIFESFGDNSLAMVLRCFVNNIDLRMPTISALNELITEKFEKAGIVIAFPQRDLHLDTQTPLRIRIEETQQEITDPGNAV